MDKVFFSPQYLPGKTNNPYCDNYINSIKDYFIVIPKSKYALPRGFEFFLGTFRADIYIVNWSESISGYRFGFIQAILAIIGLFVIRVRKKKIIWMFHNIHPHGGEDLWSKNIKKLLYKWSNIIIAHSAEAADYVREHSYNKVYYKCHPIHKKDFDEWNGEVRYCDFYLWGDIIPYKGVPEFLKFARNKSYKGTIFIVGRTINDILKNDIESYITDRVIFENRRADYNEIAAQCKSAKYVLFPYIGESISSSGVLMDTLMMGGVPVGPNRGAFADLAAKGCCVTYDNIEEVFSLPLAEGKCLRLQPDKVKAFIDDNTWESFGRWLFNIIESEKNKINKHND